MAGPVKGSASFFAGTGTMKIICIHRGDSSKLASDSSWVSPDAKKAKRTAAILALPIPFGIFGGHRIYLGVKPHIPVVYIATLGGCLGILPFIDFIVILLDKDIEKYKNNTRIFMWNK